MRKLFLITVVGVLAFCTGMVSANTYTVGLSAREDIQSSDPTETAGTWPYAGYMSGWGSYYIAYYKFQLPDAPSEQITGARVDLGSAFDMPASDHGSLYFKWVADDNWTQGSLNWSNAPETDYNRIIATGVPAILGSWGSWTAPADVTNEIVSNEGSALNGQFISFAVMGTNTGGTAPYDGCIFAAIQPTLTLDTATVPEPGSLSVLLGGLAACAATILRRKA